MIQAVEVGAVLAGKYRVEKVLGRGGMGMVVAAIHLELEQRVAIKFMLPEALVNESATDRFLREARAVVRLRSEHVCRVLDVGRLETGAPYIVMEMLEGLDFAQVLHRNAPLAVQEAVDKVLQALEGVAEAHANGIVHRDLKPANLFVTTHADGTPLVKVLDFGISKTATGVAMTRTGDMIGSPAYMAPEQMASSKDVDARADIWALGVILYEAVTGRYPFGAETLPALVMNVMQGVPDDLDTVRPGLPRGFGSAVMRCLLRAPGDRHADVAELAAAIAPFGSRSATDAAARISRVLRRALPGRPTPIPTAPVPHAPVSRSAATQATSSHPAAISTMQASSAALPGHPARSRRSMLIAASAALGLIGGGVAIALMNARAERPDEPQIAGAPALTEPTLTGPAPPTPAPSATAPTSPSPSSSAPPATASPPTAPQPIALPEPTPSTSTPADSRPASRTPERPASSAKPAGSVPTPARPIGEATVARAPVAKPPTPPAGPPPSSVLIDPQWDGGGAPVEELPEKLTRMMLSPVIARIRYHLKACADDLEAPGDIQTKVTIAPDGRVTTVMVDTGGKATLDKCITRELKAATFPKTRKGGSFTRTFTF